MLKIEEQFKEARKIFSEIETKIIPNTAKLVMNQGINAGIKEASTALKKQWKVTKSGKEGDTMSFDRKGRKKGSKSSNWLSKIKFFKLREARNKDLKELESNFKFLRPRKSPGLIAFAVGSSTPANQKGIRMKNRRFPRKKTKVFLRGKTVVLNSRFIVKTNNATQIFKHKGIKSNKYSLAKQIVTSIDDGISSVQRDNIKSQVEGKIIDKFKPEYDKRIMIVVKKHIA